MATPWDLLIGPIFSLIDKFVPDPQEAANAKIRAAEMAQKGELAQLDADLRLALGQMDVNKVEAGSDNLFKSGWRPAVGWTCVAGLAYQVLFNPILGWIAQNLWQWKNPPNLDIETLMTLLFGILGLGAYRTAERLKGKIG